MPEPAPSTTPPIHCVVWHAPDAPPSPELTALLALRGLTLETCTNAYSAAARLCRAERAARALRRSPDADLSSAPPTPAPSLVLLLVEPSRLSMREALARVLELHAPRTICWVYERLAGPTLRTEPLSGPLPRPASNGSASTSNGTAAGPPPPSPAATEPLPEITLPAPPARRDPTLTLTSAPQVPINTGSVLTDEELGMLLSDDDPPGRRPRTTSK